MEGSTWSPRQIHVLMEGLKAGQSAAEIARHLGMTRNAVLGKINRMRQQALRGTGGEVPRTRPSGWRRKDDDPRKNDPRARPSRTRPAKPIDDVIPQECLDAEEIAPRLLQVLELEEDDCRWPYGGRAPYRFCGHKKHNGGAYCAYHHKVGMMAFERSAETKGVWFPREDNASEA